MSTWNFHRRAPNKTWKVADGSDRAPAHFVTPQVLSLKDLSYGRGLPAGMAEAKQIEAMREKRAFDAYLASLDGPDALVLRRKAMEERELREWASREAEIRDLQEERLELLQTAIERREQEADEALQTRLANLREQRTAEKATALAAIQKKRVAAMRKLGAARTAHSVPSEPHTFLDTALEKSIKAGQVHAPTPSARREPLSSESSESPEERALESSPTDTAHTPLCKVSFIQCVPSPPHPLSPQRASAARRASTRRGTSTTPWTCARSTCGRTRSRQCSWRGRSLGGRWTRR